MRLGQRQGVMVLTDQRLLAMPRISAAAVIMSVKDCRA